MTLASSGTLHLKGSAVYPTRSIVYECTGFYTAYNIRAAQIVASAYVGSLPTSMQDFYGYSGCSVPVPGVPSSCSGTCNGFIITVSWGSGTNATNYRVQYAKGSEGYSTWYPTAPGAYDTASPWTTSNPSGSYRGRVLSENCAGSSAYRTSSTFSC